VSLPAAASAGFTPAQRTTLDAALARLIPTDGPGDWSAADLGAGDYIERLLSGDGRIYAGGPMRAGFDDFRPMPRAKEMGWAEEIARLRDLYAEGLAELDRRAGGDFAAVPAEAQDAILTTMDLEGSGFFRELFAHTMEGVYSHPVYGGNRGYRAWKDLCYEGDVHGVRFPGTGDPQAAWNVHGGYAPQEMAQPGSCPEPQE
ncbi:MAG: gluconate 2-dehydrogenase subunit 3 family protein, partial [Actinomycetota bacterium]